MLWLTSVYWPHFLNSYHMSMPVVVFSQEFLVVSVLVPRWVISLCVTYWGFSKHRSLSHTHDLLMLAKPSIICISGLTACWTIPAIPASMLFCLSLLQPSDTHLLAPLLIGVKACILYLWVQSTRPLCLSPICFEGLQRHVKSSECSCGLAQPFLSGVLSACRTSSFPETHPSSLLL